MNTQLNLKSTAHGAGIKKTLQIFMQHTICHWIHFSQVWRKLELRRKNIYDRYTISRSLMVYGLRIFDAWEADRRSPGVWQATHSGRRESGGMEGGALFFFYKYFLGGFFFFCSPVVRVSDCQCTGCNGPGFDPSIRRHSGIWGAADEAVLNIVRTKKGVHCWVRWKGVIRDWVTYCQR